MKRITENTEITLTIGQLRRLVVENSAEDYPDMSDEVANRHNVVSAKCCRWCGNYKTIHGLHVCKLLGCRTFDTDVCDEYSSMLKQSDRFIKEDSGKKDQKEYATRRR